MEARYVTRDTYAKSPVAPASGDHAAVYHNGTDLVPSRVVHTSPSVRVEACCPTQPPNRQVAGGQRRRTGGLNDPADDVVPV